MNHGDIADSVFCVGAACAVDLPDILYLKPVMPKDYLGKNGLAKQHIPMENWPRENAKRRPHFYEVEVYSFPQVWSSTALGFGGMGGAAMTTAQTTVVIHGNDAAVYFGRRLAYVVSPVNIGFMSDVRNHQMASVSKAGKYKP